MPKKLSAKTGILLCVCLFMSSCYNRFEDIEAAHLEDFVTNITIKEVIEMTPSSGFVDVDRDISLRGVVTAHDKSGNLYKSLFIESGGYGLELLEGLYDSSVRHELGCEIVVKLKGLRLSKSNEVVQVGVATEAGSYYDLGYMQHEVLVDKHIINCGYVGEVKPREYTISELYESSNANTICYGSLVCIRGVRYIESQDNAELVWQEELAFKDAENTNNGSIIYCYISDYANFSNITIPDKEGSITGILRTSYTNEYKLSIIPRTKDDLNF